MQFALLGLLLAHLAHQALGQAGVGGQTLVEVGDLLAQILLFQLQQGFRVLALQVLDEQGEDAFEDIAQTGKHGVSLRYADNPSVPAPPVRLGAFLASASIVATFSAIVAGLGPRLPTMGTG
ncbi:hypothetical protein D9M68_837530 [compost metagenome]